MSAQTVYEPLESNHVRILTLLLGSGRDLIHCTWTRIPVKDASSTFVVLSYAWGVEPNKNADIIIDGFPFLVRPNLYHGLLRRPRKSSHSQKF
jgi:hypothetical protein